jgi:sodium/pantothenate symporter
MITGVASFIIINKYWPRPFGMHPIVITLFLGFVAFYTVSLLTKPPKENTIKKFWSV